MRVRVKERMGKRWPVTLLVCLPNYTNYARLGEKVRLGVVRVLKLNFRLFYIYIYIGFHYKNFIFFNCFV